jgi:hypothetical protein
LGKGDFFFERKLAYFVENFCLAPGSLESDGLLAQELEGFEKSGFRSFGIARPVAGQRE